MPRTKLSDRKIPGYTKGEEIFNMVSHIVGGGIGFIALVACAVTAAYNQNVSGIISGIIYGLSLILLFTMSSIYHGLPVGIPKKVFQILDHCTIFILIAGTYTPILLCKFKDMYPLTAWINLAVIWGLAIVGIILNSIDLHKFRIFSIACYLGMGWMAVFSFGKLAEVYGETLCLCLIVGGVCYTIGAVLYVLGKKMNKKYIHSVFHIFVDVAALVHFLGIVVFVMPN